MPFQSSSGRPLVKGEERALIAGYSATERQIEFIEKLVHQLAVPLPLVLEEVHRTSRTHLREFRALTDLSRADATWCIDWLIRVRDGHAPRPVPREQRSFFHSPREAS